MFYINVLYFLSCNSSNGNSTYNGKTVNFRNRMNDNITAFHFRTSTKKFDSHVCKWSKEKEHIAKEPYFNFYAFMTVDNKK